jgi:hypothetical protein
VFNFSILAVLCAWDRWEASHTCFSHRRKTGSAQEFGATHILGCFL